MPSELQSLQATLHGFFRHVSVESLLKLINSLHPRALYQLFQKLFRSRSSINAVLDKPRNLWQLLEKAAANKSNNGISIYSPGQINQIGLRLRYRDLQQSSAIKSQALSTIEGITSDSVILLHFDNHLDAISWFWAVTAAGLLPPISTPFTNDLEAHKKHLVHLQTALKNPVILTSRRLVPEFLDVEGLNIHTIEDLQAAKKEIEDGASRGIVTGSLKGTDDVAALMLTSGSTGHAKAVALRHVQMLTSGTTDSPF